MAEINYPDKYKNKLFLTVKDMIFSNSFWAWYNML